MRFTKSKNARAQRSWCTPSRPWVAYLGRHASREVSQVLAQFSRINHNMVVPNGRAVSRAPLSTVSGKKTPILHQPVV